VCGLDNNDKINLHLSLAKIAKLLDVIRHCPKHIDGSSTKKLEASQQQYPELCRMMRHENSPLKKKQ
jgi:hypothetical protein